MRIPILAGFADAVAMFFPVIVTDIQPEN